MCPTNKTFLAIHNKPNNNFRENSLPFWGSTTHIPFGSDTEWSYIIINIIIVSSSSSFTYTSPVDLLNFKILSRCTRRCNNVFAHTTHTHRNISTLNNGPSLSVRGVAMGIPKTSAKESDGGPMSERERVCGGKTYTQ